MSNTTSGTGRSGGVFTVSTAAELMTGNPLSVRRSLTLAQAAKFLSDQGVSAAPVIDEAGRPVGVISRTDLVRFDAAAGATTAKSLEFVDDGVLTHVKEKTVPVTPASADTPVSAVMTPLVLSVAQETPAADVVRKLVQHRVHRVFVTDGSGVLVGVISSLDLLSHLKL